VLDVESSDLVGWRETVDLVVDDGVHQGRLSGTVSTTKTVSVTSLESHTGVMQENLGTVGQVELLNVAEILTLFLVVKLDLVTLGLVGLLLEQFSDSGKSIVRRNGELGVGGDSSLPSLLVVVVGVDERSSQDTSVGETRVGLVDRLVTVLSEQRDVFGGNVVTFRDLERREIGSVRLGGDLSDSSEGGDSSASNSSGLGVGNSLESLDQSREQLGQEWSDSVLGIDKLGHVVGDNTDLSLGGSGSLVETSDEKGSNERNGGGSDFGNEGGGGKKDNGLGDLFDRVEEGLDEGRDELFNLFISI
jgi:hypothetical protein